MSIYAIPCKAWPDDPSWPDPYGNDPYDITHF
jgi:hypothetical protein